MTPRSVGTLIVRNGFKALTGALTAAIDAGLVAAGQVVVNEAKYNVRGDVFAVPESPLHHVTGNLMNSITALPPQDRDGVRTVLVGTNVDYGLFWELGWRPAFGRITTDASGKRRLTQHEGPRRFLRHEWLRPAAMATLDEQAAAFNRVAVRMLAGAATGAATVSLSEAAD